MIKKSTVDVILLIALLFSQITNMFVLLGIAGGFLDYVNELVFVLLTLIVCIEICNQKLVLKKSFIWILLFLAYFIFQILYLKLPFTSILQAIIYLQAPVYFYYFYNKKSSEKKFLVLRFASVISFLTKIVIGVGLIECVFPEQVVRITHLTYTERGLFGWFYIGSIFGSNIALIHFCIISLSMYFVVYFLYNKKIYSDFVLFLLSIIVFFAFSRKEVSLFAILMIFTLYLRKNRIVEIKRISPYLFLLGGLLLVYFNSFFSVANEVAFSEDYVRFQIYLISLSIFLDYFPFGSGIGTFGSQMSVKNNALYAEYGANNTIFDPVTGEGVIYDLFFPTFTAELGMGIVLFIAFIIYIWGKPVLDNCLQLFYLKRFLILIYVVIIFFAPLWMNPFGLILMSVLALISSNNNEKNAVENI